MKKDYSKSGFEHHYHYIEPKIICEQYLKEIGRKNPLDYKFYCFNGKVECVLLYNINKQIYFGEMTFTPAAGLINYNTDEALKYLGDKLKLKDDN